MTASTYNRYLVLVAGFAAGYAAAVGSWFALFLAAVVGVYFTLRPLPPNDEGGPR